MALNAKVRDVMTIDLRGISEEATLQTAAEVMVQRAINSLIVWPIKRDQPYGILTSSDIVDAVASGKAPETRVGDLQSAPLVVVTPGVLVVDAARLMSRHGLRHLAVFNGKDLVGIVSNRDVLKGLTGPFARREIQEPIPA